MATLSSVNLELANFRLRTWSPATFMLADSSPAIEPITSGWPLFREMLIEPSAWLLTSIAICDARPSISWSRASIIAETLVPAATEVEMR